MTDDGLTELGREALLADQRSIDESLTLTLLISIVGEWYSHRYDGESPNFDAKPMTLLLETAKGFLSGMVTFDALGFTDTVYNPVNGTHAKHGGHL